MPDNLDERLSIYLERFGAKKKTVVRWVEPLEPEQLSWVPAGITNPLTSIIRHCPRAMLVGGWRPERCPGAGQG